MHQVPPYNSVTLRVTVGDTRSRSPALPVRSFAAIGAMILRPGMPYSPMVGRRARGPWTASAGEFALPFRTALRWGHAGRPRASYRYTWLPLMGKEKGFALTSIRAREMRRFLERQGYVVEPGQHKHLKLRHEQLGDVLLPLRPSDNLSHVALKQIAKAMGVTPEELMRRVK